MTTAEILTLLVSLVAVAISWVSLVRTRRLSERQLELQETTAALAAKQLTQIEQSEAAQATADIRVELTKLGKGYCFLIINRGPGIAYSLDFELIDCADSPLLRGEIARKLPYPELRPDSRVKLRAALHMGSPTVYTARVSWQDASGGDRTEDMTVSL